MEESYPPKTNDHDLESLEYVPAPSPVEPSPRRSFKYWGKKIIIVLGVIIIGIGLFFTYRIFSAGEKMFLGKKDDSSLISQIKKLILPTTEEKLGQEERINILLIGIRGTGHNKDQGGGHYLADTIMVLGLKPQTREVSFLSIPRDLWVDVENYGQAKINAAYAYGMRDDPKQGGALLLNKTVENVLGIPIHYYVVVDFAGFEQAIDTIGGIDLEVERSFTDYFYPTWNYEFQTISFQAGLQHMDGDTALKFVRSRHGTNSEGSDFARAKRQQKILSASKDKLFSISTILNPIKLSKLVDSMGNHFITNLDLSQAKELIEIAQEVNPENITSIVLDNSREGYLVSSRSDQGASILVPRTGDFSEIQNLARNIFDTPSQAIVATEQITITPPEEAKTKIQIRNGTTIQGLAGKTAVELKKAGYEIAGILNADSQNYEKTVIYDYTEGAKNDALEDLKNRFSANVSAGRTFFLEHSPDGSGYDADFIIILGWDQKL